MGTISGIIGAAFIGSIIFYFGVMIFGDDLESAYAASKIGFFVFGGMAVWASLRK